MTLADFIEANVETLINDWSRYADQLNEGRQKLSAIDLRNSAKEMLTKVAANMRQAQTPAQQRDKSHGGKRDSDTRFDAISVLHADDRLAQGFGLNEVVAEYRALRASVVRRWEQTVPLGPAAFQEMIRFNEAIDQCLTESVRQFSERTERIRDLFAGVLAHDLRSPLGVIVNSTEILFRDDNLSPASVKATAYVQRSAARMKWMIDDLLVFARTRLGDSLPITLTQQDMGRLCRDAAEEVGALFPDATIQVAARGDLAGRWDGGRIGQLLFNLLSNAARYGAGGIDVQATGAGDGITVVVSSQGTAIPARSLPTLFDPLTRVNASSRKPGIAEGIGLGLYICRCIATAHAGTIEVASDDRRTAFTLRLPHGP